MQLLEHFKELTVRPKNAKELKGLILQLAIQGKLTAKWRDDNKNIEPASELLKRIQKEKELLVKEKKFKKDKQLLPIQENEKPYKLSGNWVWCRIQDIIKISSGKGLTSAKMDKSGKVPVYGGNGITGYHSLGNVEKPTIVIGRVGFYCGSIHLTENIAWVTDNAFITYYSEVNIFRDFLLILLRGTNLKEDENATAQPVISGRKVYPIVVSLPPLEEQKEIVKVVETLFKEVEQLEQLTVERIGLKENFVIAALNQLTTNNTTQEWAYLQEHFKSFFNEKTNIKKLRETVLQLAVQGKLTADWRAQQTQNGAEVEDASVLLKRIQKEKAQLIKNKKIKKEKVLPKITKEEIPYELPVGWVWCRMIELCQYITDGTHQTPKYTESGRMFISAKNVKPFRFMPEIHKYVSEEDFEGYRRNRKPELNDILLTRVGAGIGEATLIDQDLEFAIYVSVGLLKMFPNKLDPNYIVMWLNSPEGRQYSSKNTYGKGVSQGNLNLSLIRKFVVSLPPLEEQKAIVQKVYALMGLCDKLEQEVQQSQEHSEQLMQSCLREVFEPNNLN